MLGLPWIDHNFIIGGQVFLAFLLFQVEKLLLDMVLVVHHIGLLLLGVFLLVLEVLGLGPQI